MAVVGVATIVLDQLTKLLVVRMLEFRSEKVVLDGFFKFVHWGNTGAAWSLFYGHSAILAIVSIAALGVLFWYRHYFDTSKLIGQIALGLVFGGIIGNLIDRVRVGHVIDFIRFYLYERTGEEIGFPAFNVADSAICTGVGLFLIISWRNEHQRHASQAAQS
jgi:signal peptidase II